MSTAETASTAEKFHLTPRQIQQYKDDGYVIVKNVITREHAEDLKRRSRLIVTGEVDEEVNPKSLVRDVRVAKGKVMVDDPELGMWKLMDPDKYDPVFSDYPLTPKFLDVVEGLVGPDILAFLLMVIYKPPGMADAVHHYHQDGFYFPFGPLDDVLGSWIALDATTAENGTLRVIPGSHKDEIQKHEIPKEEDVNFGIFGVEGADGDKAEVVAELEPGDGIFFHSRLLHKTDGNSTDGHRRIITVHMAAAGCKWTAPKPNTHFKMRVVRGARQEGCV